MGAIEDIPHNLLYKYISWNNEHHKRIIKNGEIYFASPDKFNDPFDCAVPIRFDLMSSDAFAKAIRLVHPEYGNGISGMFAKIYKDLDEAAKIEILNSFRKHQYDYINENTGLFCMTDKKDDILMWSHYANCHKGICVGFDVALLLEYFVQICTNNGLRIACFQVDYVRDFPVLIPRKIIDDDIVRIPFYTKAIDWSHEREYRFILLNATNVALKLDLGIIKEIILGCKIEDATVQDVLNNIKDWNNIRILKASKNSEKYELDFTTY